MNKDGEKQLKEIKPRSTGSFFVFSPAVQNERQPRNTATVKPETIQAMDSEKLLREAVGAFG